jgi:hypothetical protein
MTVNYKDWEDSDRRVLSELGTPLFARAGKGDKIRLLDFYPEFDIKEGETFTVWFPNKLAYPSPANNLANLAIHYNKIVIPIFGYKNRQDFENIYGMAVDNLAEIFEQGYDKFLPLVTQAPSEYATYGYCDKLFDSIQRLRGKYPPHMIRTSMFQRDLTLRVMANNEGIPQTEGWTQIALNKFPELDLQRVRNIEVKQIADPKQLYSLAREQMFDSHEIERILASTIVDLRAFGYDKLTGFLTDRLYKKYGDLSLLYSLLLEYRKYLVDPLTLQLGGFCNYSISNLEEMAFLRLLPLVNKDLKKLDKTNYELFLNSPGARSSVSLRGYNMTVFLRGGDDINTLNDIAEFAERHKKETTKLSEYRQLISEGKLSAAGDALRRAGEVYTQIGEEVKQLEKTEKRAKLGTYAISGGANVLSDMALYFSEGIPAEWKLVIALFKDIPSALGIRNIDPKRVVDLLYDVKGRPWYERGVPYLFWRGTKDV